MLKRVSLLLSVVMLFSLIGNLGFFPNRVQAAASLKSTPTSSVKFAPGIVLIGLKSEMLSSQSRNQSQSIDHLQAIVSQYHVQKFDRVFPNQHSSLAVKTNPADQTSPQDLSQIYRLHVSPQTDIPATIKQLQADPTVAFAEPDYLAQEVTTTPNDPNYSDQWGLTKIQADQAWDITQGSSDVTVAVVDAGIDAGHQDLASQLWNNPGEIPGNGIDDDNDGFVDDIHGANILGNNVDLTDATGHGTQVAGVIAAETNNAKGIAGVCWQCKLMIVKVMSSGGTANYSDIAAGVAYAAQKGAKVINLSLGGYNDSATLRAAVALASQTAVVVGGAGNGNTNNPFYPAAYTQFGLAVAGTTQADTKKDDSNYGSWISISAPGDQIYTTFDGGSYGPAAGTSMAAPFVSGLAGLIISQHPDWSPAQVRAQIIQTTDSIDSLNPGLEGTLGKGRINAWTALKTSGHPMLSAVSFTVNGTPNGRVEPGSTVDLYVTLQNDWAVATDVTATLTSANANVTIPVGTTAFGTVSSLGSQTNATPLRISLAAAAGYNADLQLKLNITNGQGYPVTIPLQVFSSTGVINVQGTLSTQTWTSDHTYVVVNNVGVGSGQTLTIQPGTNILFAGNYSFSVAGILIADGTAAQPIHFTRQGSSVTWGAINFLAGSGNATFDGGGNYVGGSIVRNVLIEYGQGISLNGVAPYIANNMFNHDTPGIMGSGGAELIISGNSFLGSGISISGGYAVSHNVLVGGSISVYGINSVNHNSLTDCVSGTGISASSVSSVSFNRVINCGVGMSVSGLGSGGGAISNNLIANNTGNGLVLSGNSSIVTNNTIVANGGASIYVQSSPQFIHYNNIVPSNGQFGLRNTTTGAIDADLNWWGVSDSAAIPNLIYDGMDEFGLGIVGYSGYLSTPDKDSPAYVTDVHMDPASPVGIQTISFTVGFSRPMDTEVIPNISFSSTHYKQFVPYNSQNSGIASGQVTYIAMGKDQSVWFSIDSNGFLSPTVSVLSSIGNWTTYTPSNSGLLSSRIFRMTADPDGNMWFAQQTGVTMRSNDGKWIAYPRGTSGLACYQIADVEIDKDGNVWIGCDMGGEDGDVSVLHKDGTWTTYRKGVGNPLQMQGGTIFIDKDNNKWFSFYQATGYTNDQPDPGVVRLSNSGEWTLYNRGNSGIISSFMCGIAQDNQGNLWMASCHQEGISILSPSGQWKNITSSNSFLLNNNVYQLKSDRLGAIWIETPNGLQSIDAAGAWHTYPFSNPFTFDITAYGNIWASTDNGATLYYRNGDYLAIDNAKWQDELHFQVSTDINSLIPKDSYITTICGAKALNSLEPACDNSFKFAVDYAGSISDMTPPSAPFVFATGKTDDPSYVEANWSGQGVGYRYAVGSGHGLADIINWTPTSATSIIKELGLISGKKYWVSVQVRNAGGLWSPIGESSFISGQPSNRALYLPLMRR